MMLIESTLPQARGIISSSIAAAVFVTFCYHLFSLHLLPYPDSMYPAMKVTSWTGRVHFLYMAIQLTVVSLGLWTLGLLAAGKIAWSPEITVGVALAFFGGVFYEATWIFGIKKNKRFAGFGKRLSERSEKLEERKASPNVHPSLLLMCEVVKEETIVREHGLVVQRLTLKLPTLDQVREHYSHHFEELRGGGDPRADAKERSFYQAIERDLARQDADGTITIEQPFIQL